MSGVLKGKKTYIVAALGVAGAAASYLVGDASAAQAGQAVLTALLAATLRNGLGRH
jgi:hypothetical protein